MPLPIIPGPTFDDIKAKLFHQRPSNGSVNYFWTTDAPDNHVSDENDQIIKIAYKMMTLHCAYNAENCLTKLVYSDRVGGVKFTITECGHTSSGGVEFRFESQETRGCGHGVITIDNGRDVRACGEGPIELIVELLKSAVC